MTASGGRRRSNRPTLACLHADRGNIVAIDGLFLPDAAKVVHYVDPGLLRRAATDPLFPAGAQATRVARARLDRRLLVRFGRRHLHR